MKRPRRGARRSDEEHTGHVFALMLSTVAFFLILGADLFFIQDHFNARMNTVFKLYYQSWLLLSVAGGFALYELTRNWRLPSLSVPQNVRFEASFGNWSIGEVVALSAALVGAIIGIVLMRDSVFGLVLFGALIGGSLLFAAAAALVLLYRATEPKTKAATARGALGWRAVWAGGAAALLLAAFVYPLTAPFQRTNGFDGRPRTLDGLAYLQRNSPDEYDAIRWLADRDGRPVIAQAIGEGYRTETSRVSSATGLPTILGWPGHESQWRGGFEPQEGRPEDLETLYTSTDPDQVRSVIQKYDVAYVFLGPVERDTYDRLAVEDMAELFEPVFEQGEVTIYRVRGGGAGTVTRDEP